MPTPDTLLSAPRRDWLMLIHRISAFIGLPFLLISIVLAVALSHVQWLEALSHKVYASLPVPKAVLDEPVNAHSLDQLSRMVGQTTGGGRAGYITLRDNGLWMLAVIPPLTEEQKKNFHHLQKELVQTWWVNPQTMQIVRVENGGNSLVSQGHGIHGTRFFGMEWFSIALVTSISLLLLLITGAMLARRDKKAFAEKSKMARWHIRIGQILGILTLIIVLTTLQMEFAFVKWNIGAEGASHPIAALALNEPLKPGSIDQARNVVAQAIGTEPRGVFVYPESGRMKFLEGGDGIGGQSVWLNSNTMQITRITDWRNDLRALNFILHDGRWLGGMNAFNINDAAALGLLFLALSGVVLTWRARRA